MLGTTSAPAWVTDPDVVSVKLFPIAVIGARMVALLLTSVAFPFPAVARLTGT